MIRFMLFLLLLCYIWSMCSSCTSGGSTKTYGPAITQPKADSTRLSSPFTRGKVLENGTIVAVYLSEVQRFIYRKGDTVWIDLSTHTIDDTLSTAMKCVLTN